jgi:uncharacterized membrane protein YgcG
MMIAHKKENLHTLWLHRQAAKAEFRGRLSRAETEIIEKKYPTGLYSPNTLIRFGLFWLAGTAISAGISLTQLIFPFGNNNILDAIHLFVWGLASFFILEYLIRKHAHYRSGVDEALIWVLVIAPVAGLNLLFHLSSTATALLAGILSLLAILRYTNFILVGASLISFSVAIYLEYTKIFPSGKSSVCFLLLPIYLSVILLARRWRREFKYRFYDPSLRALEMAGMVLFYICSNYYIQGLFQFNFVNGSDVNNATALQAGWLYWFLTISSPFIFISIGIWQKEAIPLRFGLIALIPSFLTYRYYYHVLPIEWVMLILGFLLIIIAYILTTYLKTNRKGYSSRLIKESFGLEQAEALLIAGTLTSTGNPPPSPATGGGSSGGGGATGNY